MLDCCYNSDLIKKCKIKLNQDLNSTTHGAFRVGSNSKKIVFEDSKQLLKVFSSAIMVMTKVEALFIIVLRLLSRPTDVVML